MFKIDFNNQDTARFLREIRNGGRGMRKRAKPVILGGLFDILTDSKKEVRVKTGRLRASGRVIARTDGLGGEVSYPLDYASFEHFGTQFMSGSFHLLKAVEKNRASILRELEEVINEGT